MKRFLRLGTLGGRQSLISLASFCISFLALTALLPVLVRTLGAREYGAWVLTGGIANYVLVFDFGLSIAVTRFVALHRSSDVRQAEEAITIGLVLLTVVGVLIVVITQLTAPALAAYLDVPEASFALRAGGIGTTFVLLTTIVQSALEGAGRVSTSRVLQAGGSLLFIAGGIVVTVTSSKRLTALSIFLVVQTLLVLLTFVFVLIRAWGGLPLRWPASAAWKRVAGYALTMQGSSIFVASLDPASRFLVAAVAGPSTVAPVDVALRARAQWFGAALAFTRPLLPELGSLQNSKAAADRADFLWRRFAPVGVATGLFLAVASYFVVPALFGSGVGETAGRLSAVAVAMWIPAVTAVILYVFLLLYGTARDILVIQTVNALVGLGTMGALLPVSTKWAPIIGLGTGSVAATLQTFRVARRRAAESDVFRPIRTLRRLEAGPLGAPLLAGMVFLLPGPLYVRSVVAVLIWLALISRSVVRLLRESR